MLNAIKQLKQQNEVAFNFALAGVIALLLAVSGLVLLWHGLIEQRQITKQVGDLQMIASRIETIVISKKLAVGEKKAFLEFENNIKSFNQQWTELKQQHNYSDKTIKEADVVWQRINTNAQKSLLMKKDMMALKTVVDTAFVNFKFIYKINDELVSILLAHNTDSHQLSMVKELAVLFMREENAFASIYMDDVDVVMSEDDYGFGNLHQIKSILNVFLSGDSNLGTKKLEDVKIREMIENYMTLVDKKINSDRNKILNMSPMLFQVLEAQKAIFRDNRELKSTLAKLNNHQLNKGLIVFVVCVWLAFFACVFGFLRALNTKRIN